MTITLMIITGIITGLFTGLLGSSSGAIMVPLLLVVFHYIIPQFADNATHLAVGTSLAVSAISVTVAMLTNCRHVQLHPKIFWSIILGTLISYPIAGYLSSVMSGPFVQLVFACLVFLVPFLVLKKSARSYSVMAHPIMLGGMAMGTSALGFITGLGGGPFIIALYNRAGFDIKTIIGNLPYSGVPLITGMVLIYVYIGWGDNIPAYSIGYVYSPALLWVGLPNIVCTMIFARIRQNMNQNLLQQIYVVVLLIVGAGMLINSLSQLGWF